jgi:cell division protein FtsB
VFFGLLIDGSLLRLWRLNRDSKELTRRIAALAIESKTLDQKIVRAHDPAFIELQAREKLDLASEGDLVFVFSDDE